jgi:PAS domain S-box-containing protein
MKEEEIFRGRSRLLEMVASDTSLTDVLTNLVLFIEDNTEDLRCSVLLLSHDGKHSLRGAAPNLPEAYLKAVDGAPIGPRSASCGTAMHIRQPVLVTDVTTDSLWPDYRDLLKCSGLYACWSTPILSQQGDVLGSFAMFCQEKRGPRPDETQLAEIATHLAGIAIAHENRRKILRDSEDRLRLAAEGSRIGIWSYDEATDEVVWDAATRKMFYVPLDAKVTLETFYGALHPDDTARVREEWRRAVDLGLPYNIEYRTRGADGSIRWINARGHGYYDETGKPVRMTGVHLDITDQKRAEMEAQKQRETLSNLSRVSLVGEMSATIAHEINQPLAAISNNAAAARRFAERGNSDQALLLDCLGAIIADSKRASDVIRGIKTVMHKGKGVRLPIDINSIVTDTVQLANINVLARDTLVTLELAPRLPQIEATPVQIQQVLLNLIANSLDAMQALPPSERRILISTCSDGSEFVKMTVRDFGPGLPKDRPSKIFDRFFSTKEQGMGIGLSVVRTIIEAHGGTIEAENAPGRGALVIVRLPAGRAQKLNVDAKKDIASETKRPRDVFFDHALRLMIFRPHGTLDEKRVKEIAAFLEDEEKRTNRPFDRFSDLSKLDAIDLDFQYVVRVSLHRLLSPVKHPPVKSAFYVTTEEAARIVNIHAIMSDSSPLEVAMFRDVSAAASWLGVSVADLQRG